MIATGNAAWATKGGGRIMRPWCWAAAVLLFLAAAPLSAQQPGDTVRVSGSLVGVVVEADSAGLRLSTGYAPYTVMGSLEVWGGTRNHPGRGFKYGFAAGGTLGTLFGVLFCIGLGCYGSEYPLAILYFGGGGGLAAGVAGAAIGALVRTDIWTPVPIPGGLSIRVAVGGR